jgi:hypothetical protein
MTMATNAKKNGNGKNGAKDDVVNPGLNHTKAQNAFFAKLEELGAKEGAGVQAKLESQIAYANAVRDKLISDSMDDAKLCAAHYDKGKNGGPLKPIADKSLGVIVAQFRSFSAAPVLEAIKDDYKTVLEWAEGKDKKARGDKSPAAVCTAVNVAIKRHAEKHNGKLPTVTPAFIAAAVKPRGPAKLTPEQEKAAAIKELTAALEAVRDYFKRNATVKAWIDECPLASA